MDEEEENELRDKIDMAMNLAEDVHDVLMPDALEYYLDLNDDMFGGEDGEDEDGDDDEFGDGGKGGNDSDEDESDKKKSKKGKSGEKKAEGGAGATPGDQKQECKQQ